MFKRNSSDKREASMGCVKKLLMERNVKRLIKKKKCVNSGSLSLSMFLAICLFLFCFVGLFLKLSLIQILALVVLSFYHFEGSFHFWAFLWGLVLRPFSTCSSLMSFSPFSRFLWLLSLLVASFSFSSSSSVLFSLGRRRAPFVCLRLFVCVFVFVYWAVFHPALSFTASVLSSFQSLDPLTFSAFSARASSLAFLCLAILFLGTCRAGLGYIYFFFSKACA